MRPTFLQFRSPKERTPDPYEIRITSNGSPIGYSRTKSPSFSRDKRFRQYDNEAKKTGYRIGPGSYSSLSSGKVKGGIAYKPLLGAKGDPKQSFYVGYLLVRDPNFLNSNNTEQEWQKKIDFSQITTSSDNALNIPMKNNIKRKAIPLNRNFSYKKMSPKIE
ncbi:hypothetical protein SteCoe_34067 [Stentor coeruleus]|uniref:Uncharacterized protein n=1 Tax=Stentor coeruleus TaxID=5963 RepID=A0A1R2AVA2_9CILI|nr:hypothetical protein SteCoe_34067 [Stentor coeruleus]